ncbi:MAG: acetate/propionate family kinase [Desulfobacterales bacterium]|nr:acetate/propionate family kinase [Deltaproteobacteria bacterium]NNK93686.1 acetate/propionate family kinase [Desulfobacterales bacterium]
MKVLVINCGASSIKYQVLDSDSGQILQKGKAERVNERKDGHGRALEEIPATIDVSIIEAVGHKVVHGGAKFFDSVIINSEVIDAISRCHESASLHNHANLAGIRTAIEILPNLVHVAVFDTAFHSRMPSRSKNYALPADIVEKYNICRFGFNGISHDFVSRRAANFLQQSLEELRFISCHLGNDASACAIEFGHSVETSMGMTPLEGLVMASRPGDVDPGIVTMLCRELGIGATEHILNRKSGLLGISGLNDMRDIETKAAEGFEPARQAIAIYAHQVRKYIGAYTSVLGGADAILLTGNIGQNSAVIRQRILQHFDYIGLRIDYDKNNDVNVSEQHPVIDISAHNARIRALVVATNEELGIAKETAKLLGGKTIVQPAKPIPIAISGRHAHLDRHTMDILFGTNSELEVFKMISQPGQYASEQTVNLVGPRDRINGVRVLGPLRRNNQIEIARTDEFRLGVDAPIRGSGQVEDSAPIILEGPRGTVNLKEGLICARRHIHMTPSDAQKYGVEDGDEVEVEISGTPRDLTFGDVLIRVSEKYILEMHIDTDEANAAELNSGTTGDLIYQKPDSPAEAILSSRRDRQLD